MSYIDISTESLLGLRVDYDRDGLQSCVDLIDIIVTERRRLAAAEAERDRLRDALEQFAKGPDSWVYQNGVDEPHDFAREYLKGLR